MRRHKWSAIIEAIIEWQDQGQLGCFGGYPSDWQIGWGQVIKATTIDGGNEPCLEITPIREFIEEGFSAIYEHDYRPAEYESIKAVVAATDAALLSELIQLTETEEEAHESQS